MSIALVRRAFELDIDAMSPSLPTEFENVEFTNKPAGDLPYQRLFLFPTDPNNDTVGEGMYWEEGFFQVLLCYAQGTGTGAVTARAQMIQDRFFRGRGLPVGSLTVVVTATPTIANGYRDGDRYCVPVRIPYHAQVFT